MRHCTLLLLICPLLVPSSSGADPLTDDGLKDVWAQVGFGYGTYEYQPDVLTLTFGVSARAGPIVATGRYVGGSGLFADGVEEIGLLAGVLMEMGPVALQPSIGLSRVWGTVTEESDFGLKNIDSWGPAGGTAYELNLFPTVYPWIALSWFYDQNSVGDYWGVNIVGRIGTFFG